MIAVLQLTGAVINTCYSYQINVRNAPKDLTRILNGLKSLRDVLERLRALANAEDANGSSRLSSSLQLLSRDDGPISELEALLKHVEKTLGTPGNWKTRLLWSFKEGEVNKMLEQMEGNKSTIEAAILTDHM